MPTSEPGEPTRPRGRGRPAGLSAGATRLLLLRTARDVIAERGIERTTIREVAERAAVNPALVHYYFETREGLRAAVLGDLYQSLRGELERVNRRGRSREQRLRQLVARYVRFSAEQPNLAIVLAHDLIAAVASPEARRLNGPEPASRALCAELSSLLGELLAPEPARARTRILLLVAIAAHAGAKPGPSEDEIALRAEQTANLLLHGLAHPQS